MTQRILGILARRFSQEVIENGAGKSRDELFPASAGGFLLREKPVQQTHFARRLFTIFPGLGVLFFTILSWSYPNHSVPKTASSPWPKNLNGSCSSSADFALSKNSRGLRLNGMWLPLSFSTIQESRTEPKRLWLLWKNGCVIPVKPEPAPYFRRIDACDFNRLDPAFLAVDDLDLRFPAIKELGQKTAQGQCWPCHLEPVLGSSSVLRPLKVRPVGLIGRSASLEPLASLPSVRID
jgi:hypothetical protein